MDEVRPSVGKIVHLIFLKKYTTSALKTMFFGFGGRSLEFLKALGANFWLKKCWLIILK